MQSVQKSVTLESIVEKFFVKREYDCFHYRGALATVFDGLMKCAKVVVLGEKNHLVFNLETTIKDAKIAFEKEFDEKIFLIMGRFTRYGDDGKTFTTIYCFTV